MVSDTSTIAKIVSEAVAVAIQEYVALEESDQAKRLEQWKLDARELSFLSHENLGKIDRLFAKPSKKADYEREGAALGAVIGGVVGGSIGEALGAAIGIPLGQAVGAAIGGNIDKPKPSDKGVKK